jgi:hypothetical protein
MVIGSPERIASLDQVKADLARLADPRDLSEAEAEEILARNAEAEEGQRRFVQDEDGDFQREEHCKRRDHVGQEVAEDDARVLAADRPRRGDEGRLPYESTIPRVSRAKIIQRSSARTMIMLMKPPPRMNRM